MQQCSGQQCSYVCRLAITLWQHMFSLHHRKMCTKALIVRP